MDFKTKNQIEKQIQQRIYDLVQITLEQYRDLGPLQGTMIVLVLNEFKDELLSDTSPLYNSLGSTKEEITEWINELFQTETKKYVQL